MGAVLLANRETGEGASGTFWQTAEAMSASEQVATASREEAVRATSAEVTGIDRFEVLDQDRAAPAQAGTFVRVNEGTVNIAQLDRFMTFLRDTVVPTLRSLKGYRSAWAMVNRDSGRMLVVSVWDTAADREASDAAVSAQRRQAAEVAQMQGPVQVKLYEATLSELSQPAQQPASSGGRTA
jgi:heme-degrading monooxygenase HmoA